VNDRPPWGASEVHPKNWTRFLPEHPIIREVPASQSRLCTSDLTARALGLAWSPWAAGRASNDQDQTPAVGISSDVVRLGAGILQGALAVVMPPVPMNAELCTQAVRGAITMAAKPVPIPDFEL